MRSTTIHTQTQACTQAALDHLRERGEATSREWMEIVGAALWSPSSTVDLGWWMEHYGHKGEQLRALKVFTEPRLIDGHIDYVVSDAVDLPARTLITDQTPGWAVLGDERFDYRGSIAIATTDETHVGLRKTSPMSFCLEVFTR